MLKAETKPGIKTEIKIGIDMDGPIANTDPVLRHLLSQRIKRNISQHEVTDWHYWKCVPGVTEDMVYSVLDEFHAEWLLKVDVVPGAINGIKFLQQRGHDVSVVTFRSESARLDTKKFMELHGIEIPLIMSPSTNKVQVCIDNNTSIMVEDRYETAVQLAHAGIQVLLTSFPWNSSKPHVDKIRRVYSWADIIDVFEKGYVRYGTYTECD